MPTKGAIALSSRDRLRTRVDAAARRMVEAPPLNPELTAMVEEVVDTSTPTTIANTTTSTCARIMEQHRQSIKRKRHQEIAYNRELASPLSDVVRGYMLRTLETIQFSTEQEERALERLLAHYQDGLVRVLEAPNQGIHPPVRPGMRSV